MHQEGGGGDDDGGLLVVECRHGGPAPAGLGGLPPGVKRDEVSIINRAKFHSAQKTLC